MEKDNQWMENLNQKKAGVDILPWGKVGVRAKMITKHREKHCIK